MTTRPRHLPERTVPCPNFCNIEIVKHVSITRSEYIWILRIATTPPQPDAGARIRQRLPSLQESAGRPSPEAGRTPRRLFFYGSGSLPKKFESPDASRSWAPPRPTHPRL
ncbi:hypothetical protein GOBAR_AA31954 [Gossypium barbadense]|uniref:Uncharacterized protein n=1 Tax=Gossypium barbadense TaxID=3634 RepID=A0A2P5WCB5_GOSBA|nr:hypothetical protein GOBAR_AA31954 [Gossypium barbadense]